MKLFESRLKAFKDAIVSEAVQKVAKFPLGEIIIEGKFVKFFDSDTDSAWIGFNIAYHLAEKKMKEQHDTN